MRADFKMEVIVCPLCEASNNLLLHQEGPFQMVQCCSCQFIYLNPRPTKESLFRFYQDYLPEDEPSVEAWQRMMEPVFKRAADLIRQYKNKGRLLDVGSGFGFFLSDMGERGWEVMGVEISQRAIDYARNVPRLTIHPGPLEKVAFPENDFDVVSSFYVIEHLPDPMAFLKECHRILKPGGFLVLRYPHTTPIKNFLRFFRVGNRLYDLPAHLSDFSPEIIQQCLERVGFKNCRHSIGGYTCPQDPVKRISSSFFGNLSEVFFYLSGKTYLLPGVSKTVLAFKG
jgi:SAM-dependent methyltransferase